MSFLTENITRNCVQEKQPEQEISSILSCFIAVHHIFVLSKLVSSTSYLGYILNIYMLKLIHLVRNFLKNHIKTGLFQKLVQTTGCSWAFYMKVILLFLLLFRFVDYHFWLPFLGFGLSPRVFVRPAAEFFDNVAFAESLQ